MLSRVSTSQAYTLHINQRSDQKKMFGRNTLMNLTTARKSKDHWLVFEDDLHVIIGFQSANSNLDNPQHFDNMISTLQQLQHQFEN